MRKRSLAAIAACLVVLVLAALVATSSAAILALIGQTFRAQWATVTFEAAGSTVRCPVTMQGSFSSTSFSVVSRTRIGSVTSARLGACSGGSATVLSETLPWSVQYSSFTGTLPRITSISQRYVGASFRVQPSGFPACLARSEEAEPIVTIAERATTGELTAIRLDETSRIRVSGEFLCTAAGRGSVAGRGSIEQATIAREETAEINIYEELITDMEVDQGGVPVADVDVKREGLETARALFRNGLDKPMHIHAAGIGLPNSEKFVRLEEPAERCEQGMVLAGGNTCDMWIRSTAGTPAGVLGGFRLTVTIGGTAGPPLNLPIILETVN